MGVGGFGDSAVDVTYSNKGQSVDLGLISGIGHFKYFFISFFL